MKKPRKITFVQLLCSYNISYINYIPNGKSLAWDYQVLNRPFKEAMADILGMETDPNISNLQVSHFTITKH